MRSVAVVLAAAIESVGFATWAALPAAAAGSPDLSVTASPVSAAIGATAPLNVTLRNTGSGPAAQATLRFVAPAGATLENIPGCSINSDNTQVTCKTPVDDSLGPGWSSTSTINVRVNSPSAYLAPGTITLATDNDSDPTDNTAPLRVTNPDGGIPGLGSSIPSGSS